MQPVMVQEEFRGKLLKKYKKSVEEYKYVCYYYQCLIKLFDKEEDFL